MKSKKSTSSNEELLKLLSDKTRRKTLLRKPSSKIIKLVRNICWNLLHGKIQLTEQERKKIAKFKRVIRALGDIKKKSGIKKKVKMCGGFLGAVVPILLSILAHTGVRLLARGVPS